MFWHFQSALPWRFTWYFKVYESFIQKRLHGKYSLDELLTPRIGGNMQALNNDRIVRDPEATAITGIKRSQRYRLEKDGLFPQRRQLTPFGRATGYLQSELTQWAASRPVVAATAKHGTTIGTGKPGPGRGHRKPAA